MESNHRVALSRCNHFIKKNITNFGEVMDKLLQDDCLTWDERSRIGQEKHIDEQCQLLMEILMKRGGKCYNSFLEVLAGSGNNHVMHEVKKAEEKSIEMNSDRKDDLAEDLVKEKDSEIDQMKFRVAELENDLKMKKIDLWNLQNQQIKTLEDLKKTKERANQREVDIRPFEKKNKSLEKEIDRLKEMVDYLVKQISLKDDTLKRAEEEKQKLANDHIDAIQSLERKNDQIEMKLTQTLTVCEKLAENVTGLTIAFTNLKNEVMENQISSTKQKQNDNSRQPMKQGVTTRARVVPRQQISTCNMPSTVNFRLKKGYQKPTE